MQALKLSLPSIRQRWFVIGLVVFFCLWSIPYSFKVTSSPTASAFLRWRPQILALDQGVDIYRVYAYPNPPIMALLLMPFACLEPMAGALAWFYVKVGMTLLAIFWVFRLIETPERPFPEGAKVLTVLLSIRPIMGDLSHGNVNLFILFLVVAALHSYTHGKDVLAGLLLALSIACKVTPALFVLYFARKFAWKTLAGCALGLVLFFFLVPGLYFGQARNVQLLSSWAHLMVTPFVVDGAVAYPEYNNQSIPGLVARLLTHAPSESYYRDGVIYTPMQYDNIADLNPSLAKGLIQACTGLFVVLIWWTCRTPTTTRGGWRLAAEFSLVLLGMLLLSERTWKHHYVTIVLPIALVSYYLATSESWQVRARLIACLAAVFLLMTSTSTVKQLGWWEESAKYAQIYGAYVWANLVLVVALVALLRANAQRMSVRDESENLVPSGGIKGVNCRSAFPG